MAILRTHLFVLLFFVCLTVSGRVWTTTDGIKSDGELFEVVGDRIGLKIRGREYHFSINRFIPSDREYVKQWSRVPRCAACSGTLGTRSTKAGKASYHTACFRCMVCRKNFGPGNRFRRDGWGGWFMSSISRQPVYAEPVPESSPSAMPPRINSLQMVG